MGVAEMSRGRRAAAAVTLALVALAAAAPASQAGVYARAGADEVVVGNDLVERRWSREALRTVALVDKRRGGRAWAQPHRDFTLKLAGGTQVSSDAFHVVSVATERLPRGALRVRMALAGGPAGLRAERTAEVFPGIAGVRTQTTLESSTPLTLSAATLDEVAAGPAAPTLHALRAGADFREPGYEGPPVAVGDPRPGTWRDTRSAAHGEALAGPGQWLSLDDGERSLVQVMERNDFPSSRAAYGDGVGRLVVDYARDVIVLGPLEENAHVENPGDGPGRERTVRPGEPFVLEAAFTGVGDHDGDEPWQVHKWLTRHRLAPRYPNAVVFNSYRTQDGSRSTGASDDMDFETLKQVAPIARELGVEVFVLDDGWQNASGDWDPSSPERPDPRWDGDPASKLRPRYPDPDFRAVREALGPMRLGLWMSPMQFNPKSRAYQEHPELACAPVGQGLAVQNALDPSSGSNESGLGTWGPAAIPFQEAKVRRAIERWDVRYFKFDFMVWLDCAGQGDLYDYHDAFLAMVDRLRHDFPHVTFQIDETNDFRLFPFESTLRGPSWFQNNTPAPERLLHNLWNPAPFVPSFSQGQHALGGDYFGEHPVATLMAIALPSHFTVWTDLRKLPPGVVGEAAPWIRFYKRHRTLLAQMVYPLLADPMEKGWTALQPWNPQRGEGALLAFRQQAGEATRTIALRNVPPRRRFDLFRAPSSRYVRTVTSSELTRGIAVTVPRVNGAEVLLIRPARRRAAARRPAERRRAARRRGDRRARRPRLTG